MIYGLDLQLHQVVPLASDHHRQKYGILGLLTY